MFEILEAYFRYGVILFYFIFWRDEEKVRGIK